jgi:Carboxypeptidase regulatory-like domain
MNGIRPSDSSREPDGLLYRQGVMRGSSRPSGPTVLAIAASIFLVAGCVVGGPLSSLIAASGATSLSPPSADPSAAPTASVAESPRVTQRPAAVTPDAALAWVTGKLTAGPTCPVETVPPNPSCAPRPVSGAIVVAAYSDGDEAARAVSNTDGSYSLELPAGTYTLTPQASGNKMMRPPEGKSITVGPGTGSLVVDFSYDTGIR